MTSPWRTSSRIQDDETRSPSAVTSDTEVTPKPSFSPSAINVSASPSAPWPKR